MLKLTLLIVIDCIIIYKKGTQIRIDYQLDKLKGYMQKVKGKSATSGPSSIIINPDWTKDKELDMQTNIKILNHNLKTYSSIYLQFKDKDITNLAYDMARSSVLRLETKYNF